MDGPTVRRRLRAKSAVRRVNASMKPQREEEEEEKKKKRSTDCRRRGSSRS